METIGPLFSTSNDSLEINTKTCSETGVKDTCMYFTRDKETDELICKKNMVTF